MTVDIRELDPCAPSTLATLLPVLQAALAVDAPLHPQPNAEFLAYLVTPRIDQHRVCVTAFDGESPTGFACLVHNLVANQDMVFGDLWIRPEYRARMTVPLLDAFKDHARGRGARRVVCGFTDVAADYEPVFTAEGGRRVDGDRRSQLDLTAIDREQYAAWAAPSEKNAHYRVEYWTAPTPEHLLAPLVAAGEAMRDAPTTLEFEHPPPDVERRRRREALFAAMGLRKHIVAAFAEDGEDGEVGEIAGFHEVYVIPGYRMADVGNTGVPKKFRGHGLGLRLKADLALRLLAAEPDVEVINTWNNTDNGPMLRVNEALGYRDGEVWQTWQFDL